MGNVLGDRDVHIRARSEATTKTDLQQQYTCPAPHWVSTQNTIRFFYMPAPQLSQAQISQIETLIDNSYSNINSTPELSHEVKASIYFSIIQQKSMINNFHHMYLDAKNFISNYFLSMHGQDFGYDQISISKLDYVITLFPDSRRETLYKTAIHSAKTNGLEELAPVLEQKLHVARLSLARKELKDKKTPRALISLLILLSTSNYTAILLTILLMVVVIWVILLPNSNPHFQFFIYQRIKITDNNLVDHLLNVVLLTLGLSDDIKVSPTSIIGTVLISLGRLVYFFFIVNIIIKQLDKRMSI